MTSLDGWSLNQKIDLLREDLEKQMKEMKVQFAMLYDYMKKLETNQKPAQKKQKKAEAPSLSN